MLINAAGIPNYASKHHLFGSRKREVIEEFLADFKGGLMTDGYAAYKYFNNLKESTHLCCWAHVRRIFVSALQNYKDIKADRYIELTGVLYKVEMESMMLHVLSAHLPIYEKASVVLVVRMVVMSRQPICPLSKHANF